MLVIKRTDSKNRDFQQLVVQLDNFLKIVDGDDNAFYHQYNGIENLNHVIVAYNGSDAVGCGALKNYNEDTAEIKRMFVTETMRSKGIATVVLNELENWAAEMKLAKIILETGKKQIEAIQLYKKNGYLLIPNYPPYTAVANSLCFQKAISHKK